MKQIILVIALIISFQCPGQITFVKDNTPWESLSKTAKKERKLILIHLEGNECEQCNEVASKGFSGVELKDIYQKNFIAIRSNVTSENGRNLAEKNQSRSRRHTDLTAQSLEIPCGKPSKQKVRTLLTKALTSYKTLTKEISAKAGWLLKEI